MNELRIDHMVKKWSRDSLLLIRKFKNHNKPFTNGRCELNVHVGDFTYGKPKILMWTKRYNVYIGKFCSIAENVSIIVDGNHRVDWISTYPFGELLQDVAKIRGHPIGKGDIRIGNDVWIGRDVLILPGVEIGDGAVIGAGSVVTKNVGDYEIVGGNPARHIRYRFCKTQIEELKKICWWDWSIEEIKKNITLLQSPEIEAFIKNARNTTGEATKSCGHSSE